MPTPSVRKFFVQFSHFVSGSALTVLFGLVTFPILTRILTKEEYGILGLVSTTMLITVAVGKAGLSNGIIRFYEQYSEGEASRTAFSSTVLISGFLFSGIVVLLYLPVIPLLNEILGVKSRYTFCFIIMSAYLFIRPLNIIILNLLRVNEKTILFNVIILIGRIVSVSLSLALLIYFVHELYGYFVGVVLGEYVVSGMLFYWFFSNFKLTVRKVSQDLALRMIKFGMPLLVTEISYLLLSYADRYMILLYRGGDALGLYSVGYNLAMYIADIISFSISYAIVPIYVGIYEKSGKKQTEEFLQSCIHYLLIGIIPICFGYYAISQDLIVFFASSKYSSAAAFSPIILLGTILLGMANVFNAGLYLRQKSLTIFTIMLTAVMINILANLVLLPSFGVLGAAIATLTACFAMVIITILLSHKYVHLRVDIKAVMYHLILSFVMILIIKHVKMGEAWMSLVAKVMVGIVVISAGVLFRERTILEKITAIGKRKAA